MYVICDFNYRLSPILKSLPSYVPHTSSQTYRPDSKSSLLFYFRDRPRVFEPKPYKIHNYSNDIVGQRRHVFYAKYHLWTKGIPLEFKNINTDTLVGGYFRTSDSELIWKDRSLPQAKWLSSSSRDTHRGIPLIPFRHYRTEVWETVDRNRGTTRQRQHIGKNHG